MKLIKITDFVLEQEKTIYESDKTFKDFFNKTTNYANFLQQPLTLGMFIACDENGNVLEEPIMFYSEKNLKYLKGIEIEIATEVNNRVKQYQQAKERVLFEGFEVCNRQDELICLVCKNEHFTIKSLLKETIEDLVQYNLTLTETALKQIL